jgi:hypothetical protein
VTRNETDVCGKEAVEAKLPGQPSNEAGTATTVGERVDTGVTFSGKFTGLRINKLVYHQKTSGRKELEGPTS